MKKAYAIDKVIDVLRSRDNLNPNRSHGATQTGRVWAAILSEHFQQVMPDIPGEVVNLMMVALKVNRAARPFKFNQDDYIDLMGYADMAEQSHYDEKGKKK